MCIDDAIEIKKPEPDSHFRLSSCQCCKGDNVAYVKYMDNGTERWKVMCFDCGFSMGGADCQHGAQMRWNGVTVEHRLAACAG